jgi:type II secretory pathway pseudopilin PulG
VRRNLKVGCAKPCAGFTYLILLFLVAIVGATLVAIAQVWHTQVQREKEQQLLFVGNQFRQAIGAYYERAPGGVRQFPKTLEQLLQDPRFPNVQRHLRQVYFDPMTDKNTWGLVRAPDGGIIGVHSLSSEAPIKVAGFSGVNAAFAEATTYKGWVFAYVPPNALPGQTGGNASPGFPQFKPDVDVSTANPALQKSPELKELETASRSAECQSQRTKDLAACSQAGGSVQPGGTATCLASASLRYQACAAGESIPSLRTQ